MSKPFLTNGKMRMIDCLRQKNIFGGDGSLIEALESLHLTVVEKLFNYHFSEEERWQLEKEWCRQRVLKRG